MDCMDSQKADRVQNRGQAPQAASRCSSRCPQDTSWRRGPPTLQDTCTVQKQVLPSWSGYLVGVLCVVLLSQPLPVSSTYEGAMGPLTPLSVQTQLISLLGNPWL